MKVSPHSLPISHLFFADDNLIIAKANVVECKSLVDCLKAYEDASGQKINLEKFGISYSPNVDLGLCLAAGTKGYWLGLY